MNPIESAEVELSELVKLFYSDLELKTELGQFQECDREAMPEVYRLLLAHQHHMTVTVEQFHQSPIELQVLATRTVGDSYARKILLRRKSDGRGVLFGIVRIDLSVLDKRVRQEIEAQRTPLGQVLIDHDVLREVRLVGLYQVVPGRELSHWFLPTSSSLSASPSSLSSEMEQPAEQALPLKNLETPASPSPALPRLPEQAPTSLYGRTAIIFCEGRPVIELLEIVAA